MRGLAVCVAVLAGCANADEPAAVAADGGSSVDGARDTNATLASDATSDTIFPTEEASAEDTRPTGVCATPPGTTVTASGAYMTTPELAVDGNLATAWNAGDYSGFIRLKFPAPTRFDRVRIAGNAAPACNETFTLTSFTTGVPTVLATATHAVADTAWLPVFEVASGAYDELLVEVAPAASWISLAEVQVFDSTAGCPSP